MTRKLIVVVLALTFSMSLGTAMAQMPPGPQHHPGPMPPPERVLQNFFQFDEAQMTAFKGLLEGRHLAMRPLAEKLGELEKVWRELFASPDPDPGSAGMLAVQMHSLRQQMGEVQKEFVMNFEALLTPEQMGKLRQLRQAVRVESIVNALRPLNIF